MNFVQVAGIASFSEINHRPSSLMGSRSALPKILFLLGAVVFAIDVADVVAAVTVGIAQEEEGPTPQRARSTS